VGETFSIVHVLIARQASVDRLSDQVGERELGARAPRVGEVLRDQVAEPPACCRQANRSSSSRRRMSPSSEVTRDPWKSIRSLELKESLQRLLLCVTRWMRTSAASSSCSNPHRSRRSTHVHRFPLHHQNGVLAIESWRPVGTRFPSDHLSSGCTGSI
jgi:hypothetical protein